MRPFQRFCPTVRFVVCSAIYRSWSTYESTGNTTQESSKLEHGHFGRYCLKNETNCKDGCY